MAIGDIRPQEDEVTGVVVSQAADEQVSAYVPDIEGEQTPAVAEQSGSAAPSNRSSKSYSNSRIEPTTLI
jgi:hypothetical protein